MADLQSCVTLQEVTELREAVKQVRIGEEIKRYIVAVAGATRSAAGVQLGASPRGSLALMKMAQASSLYDGRDFVTPEVVQEMAAPVLAHRLVMDPQARFSGLTAVRVIEDVLKKIPAPA